MFASLALSYFLASHDTKHRVLAASDLASFVWRSIGPADMGGRASDLCFAPDNGKVYFAAFATGGLFKTASMGTAFEPVFEHQGTSSIGSVVVADAPADWAGWKEDKQAPPDVAARAKAGKAKIVWVGSGEGNGRNSSSWGDGVYRSTDGGATFTHIGLEDSKDIPRLAVDPRNPDVCYAAALGHLWGPNKMRGIYKTTDAGKTWQPSLRIDDNTGAVDVILDPSHPDTVYAAMYSRLRTFYSFRSGGETGGIYRSKNAGKTWEKLVTGLPTQTGRIGLDVSRSNPKVVMAVIESDEGGARNIDENRSRYGGVFRSEDGGDTWKRANAQDPRAFYFSKIRIDPKDDKRIYLLGWDIWTSDDGGKTFENELTHKLHVDWHAMAIDPTDSDHLIVGSDGGIYQSFDRGKTWDSMTQMAVGEFYNVAAEAGESYRVMGGLQDNGCWLGPSQTRFGEGNGIVNGDWVSVGGGDGFHVAFDPTDKDVIYSESQGGSIGRMNLREGDFRGIAPDVKEGQPAYRFNWNAPFLVSSHDPTVLYLGGNCVFKLTKRGDEWSRISPDLSTQDPAKILTAGSNAETAGTVVALAESPLRQGVLWAGTDDGLIQLTQDDGKTWRNITPPELKGRYVANIEASHSAEGAAFAAIDGHRSDDYDPLILATTDFGRRWKSITGDLPKGESVRVVKEDVKGSVLYAGTETGIYVSADGGQHWAKLNSSSLPTVGVHDVVEQSPTFDLVAATHGRSIWICDDASALSQLTQEILDSPVHLFAPKAARPRQRGWRDGFWGDKFFAAANPPLGAVISYWCRDSGPGVSIKIEDASGKTVATLTGSGAAGIQRVSWSMQLSKLPDRGEMGAIYAQPGKYKLTLTRGDAKETGSFTIMPYVFNTDLPIPPVGRGRRDADD